MIGELIEKLSIANTKLYELCNKKSRAEELSRDELVQLVKQDVELCKQRAKLKNAIDRALNQAIISGGVDHVDEVKNYD